MRLLCALLLPLAALNAQPGRDLRPIPVQRRLALVIGNSTYAKAPLKNPGNDAKAMAGVLRELGFEVMEARDVSRREMGQRIDEFSSRLTAGDLGLFYFAGHGVQVAQENYLVPVDFQAASEADVKYEAYSASQVRDKMEASGARLRVLIFDACRNNPFRGTRGGSSGLAPMGSDAEGTLIAFATGDGRLADDNQAGGNGLFTQHLITNLQTPGLSLEEIFKRVKEDVYLASNRRQNPFTYDNIVGRYYFQPGDMARSNATPAATPAPRQAIPPPPASPASALQERLMLLATRAGAVQSSLATLREEQRAQGLGLRTDIAVAEKRLELHMDEAESALRAGDTERAKNQLDSAERALSVLERFWGH